LRPSSQAALTRRVITVAVEAVEWAAVVVEWAAEWAAVVMPVWVAVGVVDLQ
jgi:hypothetical protein